MNIDPAALLLFGGAAGLLTILRPRVGVLLPLAFHSAYLLRSHFFGIPTTGLEVILLSVLLGILLFFRLALLRSFLDVLRAHLPSSFLIGAFMLAATVSVFVSPHPETSWGVWKAMVMEPIFYALTLFVTVSNTWKRGEQASSYVLRTTHYHRQQAGPRRSGGALRPVLFALLIGGWVSVGASLLHGGTTADFSRLYGIYDVPNSLALILAPLTVLASACAVARDRTSLRGFARISLLLFVPVLLWTQSFGGILAASPGAIWVLWRYNRWATLLPLAGLLIAMALLGATGRIGHALASNSPLTARLQIWRVSWELIKDHPVLGVGLGTFEPAYQQKLGELLASGNFEFRISKFEITRAQPVLEWVVRDPHNTLLSFWLNTGLLGLLAITALLAITFRSSFSPSLTPFYAALLVLVIFGFVDVPYWKNDLALLWWVLLLATVVRMREDIPVPTVIVPADRHQTGGREAG